MKKIPKIAKVVVDRNLCIGAATCVAVSPKSFYMDGENKAVLKDSWTQEDNETLYDSARSCPVDAVFLYDKDGNQIWPPKG